MSLLLWLYFIIIILRQGLKAVSWTQTSSVGEEDTELWILLSPNESITVLGTTASTFQSSRGQTHSCRKARQVPYQVSYLNRRFKVQIQ